MSDNGKQVRSQLDRPNVVVVMCDQLRAFEVGCYGNDVIRTPHIDRLGAEGVRFEHAVSNNPVCMVARLLAERPVQPHLPGVSGQLLAEAARRLVDDARGSGGRASVPRRPDDARATEGGGLRDDPDRQVARAAVANDPRTRALRSICRRRQRAHTLKKRSPSTCSPSTLQ